MSFTENPARRAFLKAAGGGVVMATTVLSAPAVLAGMRPWKQTPDYDADLTLGLLMDFSPSVSLVENGVHEISLQINGTAEAFENPKVLAAIKEQPRGIAVNLVHFSGLQKEILPWRILRDEKDALIFAQDIRDAGLDTKKEKLAYGTHIGPALDFMKASMAQSPYRGVRKVVDISGDGPDNTLGPQMVVLASSNQNLDYMTDATSIARVAWSVADLASDGITINGIAICNEQPALDQYYLAHVVTPPNTFKAHAENGRSMPVPGGFVKRANGHEDYAEMLVSKLVQEMN